MDDSSCIVLEQNVQKLPKVSRLLVGAASYIQTQFGEGRSTIAGIEERSTEKEGNDSGEVEKPCRVMEPERAFHTWGGEKLGRK